MNWKRIIAKEWLIIITLTISLPLAGYGLFLYQNRLYEKEQATIKAFNPSMAEIDAYLKSKEQRRLSEMSMEELLSLRAQHIQIHVEPSKNGMSDKSDPYAHLSTKEIKQRIAVLERKGQQLLLEKQQQARTEMLAKLIPDKRSEPAIQSHLLISVVSIPFLYLCLAIIRITYWSLTTVRRRQFPIQVSESNQLAPIHDY